MEAETVMCRWHPTVPAQVIVLQVDPDDHRKVVEGEAGQYPMCKKCIEDFRRLAGDHCWQLPEGKGGGSA